MMWIIIGFRGGRMKRITALFACLMLLMTTCAYAGPVDRISSRLRDAVENTPPENIFQIKGSAKQYILLDSTEDEKAKYFVMSKQFFEPVEFDMANTQRFEPEKKGNVGYYLNTTLLNTGDDYGEKLDDEIVKHIDFQHEWLTEAGTPSGACPEDYTFTAGLSLLSQTEWMQYAGKFGAKDDGEAWWLRTGRGISGANSAG